MYYIMIPYCYSNCICKHWESHRALDYLANWICILWGPEDDSKVETCSPCMYGCRYTNKLLC